MDLKCKVTGQPQPIVRWMVNGKEIKKAKDVLIECLDDGTQHLVIKSAKIEHSGAYKCIAENKVGTVETAAEVSVAGISL